MSALDALPEERSKQKEKGAKKPRLVADPSISAQSIATCLCQPKGDKGFVFFV